MISNLLAVQNYSVSLVKPFLTEKSDFFNLIECIKKRVGHGLNVPLNPRCSDAHSQ